MNLLVRADASTQRGTGHVMRCLALAQAWQRQGGQVTFLLAERLTGLEKRLAAEAIRLCYLTDQIVVGSAADAAETIAHAQNLNATWLVVDGYDFGTDYQQKVNQAGLPLLFVDDFGHCKNYSANLILNQNVYANESFYPRRSSHTKLLLGCDYALLRAEFLPWVGWYRETKPVAQKLLVTLGGSDANNQTLKVLQALAFVETPLAVTVLIGAANQHRNMLEETAVTLQHKHHITFLQNATDIPTLIANADMAVSAGGTTNWELAFLGLPTLILIIAENQKGIAHTLQQLGVAHQLGWYENVDAAGIGQALQKHLADHSNRQQMAQRGQELVDGFGAERVVAAMMQAVFIEDEHQWSLRPALPKDSRLYWHWANDHQVRNNAFHSEPIPWDDHQRWFKNKLKSQQARLWLLYRAGEPIGQIRYDLTENDAAEISFSVASEGRGQGAGTKLLQYTRHLACAALGVMKVTGFVLQENKASSRAFEKAGFTCIKQEVVVHGKSCKQFEWMVTSDENTH
ncbi:MAG: UDP-2,4-diacetamido-2,4,6-trideoxy-beta-L-altropyranose hydrolase [Ardenticatenaceae bacterium]|nr:UDP-2,4-diacetamido-2,4,6-trideoxy-beta-L-altropyranose hydrolase [Ardenticatenaceae bacterium]